MITARISDIIERKLPHLIVRFDNSDGEESYTWALTPNLPTLPLAGYVMRAQVELIQDAPTHTARTCDEACFVIVWDAQARTFGWFRDPAVPAEGLISMLEMIKAVLVTSQMAAMTPTAQVRRADAGILLPDGRPFRG